ncbi:hypothetical protein L202_01979 [Cryptococcus amylolentus CBS 6039]|uniref:Zn(2)-C6 fungal-type domain-containing protein n=1 Tax=Cryptococcus amylolentus CBS 6039 TaxID=1295533 RepID=A0A1E3HYZ9_9TREE|nr:hypothetical protein L202_01979 [Cryptococcus amylolentus CBS 6039]ODN81564.1 hypothetical protein L202_01979 [Cryptococcus amylolentus CBS 6039]
MDGRNHPHPPGDPRDHSASSKPKGKRPSFSSSVEQNAAHAVRAFSACRNCRNKKVKCMPGPPFHSGSRSPSSRDNPGANLGPCQQCTLAGAECTYPPTRDRAAYSRQYVANLEARVQSLETIQARVMPMLEFFESSATRGRFGPLPNLSGGSVDEHEGEGEGEGGEPPDSAHLTSDVEDAGQITTDDRGNYRWIGSSNTLSLLDSFSGRPTPGPSHPAPLPVDTPPIPSTSRDTNPYFGPVAGSGVVKALPDVDQVQYPTREKAMEMIDAFFQDVHPCLPLLLEFEFRRDFGLLMEARRGGDLSWGGGFVSVLFAVFALGERAIVNSRAWARETDKAQEGLDDGHETVLPGEAEAGVIWYERAQILHYTTLKDVNIHQVQCLTLLATFQASVNAMPMSWLLAGQAIRVAQDLGLHRSTARLPMPFHEKQLRSRCWWAIYGLERMMSISLGRPLGVDDQDVDVAYPVEIDDATLETFGSQVTGTPQDLEREKEGATMSGFVALTKLCKIAGRVVHLLYRPLNGRSVSDPSWAMSQQNAINKLDKLLRDWLEHDPSKYKDPSATRKVSMLSAILSNSYFAILITLHRNFLPSSPEYPRPKPPPSSQSLSHCVDAARSVIHIASQSRTLVPPSHHLAVHAQYLWSSAVILLLCEVQARDQVVMEAVGSQVEAARRCLQALEPIWPGSRKLKELLNDVSSRAKEVITHPPPVDSRGKKRKSSSGKERQMPPPLHTLQGKSTPSPVIPQLHMPAWQSSQVPGPAEKRQRLYELSDARTPAREDDVPPLSASSSQAYYPLPAYHLPATPAGQSSLPIDNQDMMAPYDMSFDLGGVNFEGLELLQGFSGGAAGFWNTFSYVDGTYPSASGRADSGQSSAPMSASASTSGQYMPSGEQLTPGSASGSGVSPSAWQGQGQGQFLQTPGGGSYVNQGEGYVSSDQTGQGQGGHQVQAQAQAEAQGQAAFWEQVTGSTFDWQADPNVPFNI